MDEPGCIFVWLWDKGILLTSSCPDSKIGGVTSFVSGCFMGPTDLMDYVLLSNSVVSGQELTNKTIE